MSNPLYRSMDQNNNNMLMQRVQALKQQMGGDPMQHIQRMLNSGRVSQAQYNDAVRRAEQLRKMLGK